MHISITPSFHYSQFLLQPENQICYGVYQINYTYPVCEHPTQLRSPQFVCYYQRLLKSRDASTFGISVAPCR